MKNKDIYTDEDKKFKELFDSFIPSSPSNDFTKNAMNSVLQDWSSQPILTNTKMSIFNKIGISFAVVFAIVLVYVFDVKNPDHDSIVGGALNVDLLKGALNQLMGNTLEIFSHIPMVIYVVGICLLGLLFIDKMIQKLVQTSH